MRKEQLDGEDVFLIHDFFSPEECDRFIAQAEQAEFEEATISTAGGQVLNKGVRDNLRLIHDDPALAAELFQRAQPFLPDQLLSRWQLLAFNERWRYLQAMWSASR